MELILIAYPQFFKGESEIINYVLSHFNLYLHLRKPEAEITEYQKLLDSIDKIYYNRIIIQNEVKLFENYGLKGVHFSGNKRKGYENLVLNGIKSTSCHSLPELEQIKKQFNQTYLSPIYNSISKKDYKSCLNHNDINIYLKKPRKTKIIALGGISHSTITKVEELGFDGAALLGSVWGETPESKQEIIKRINKIYTCLKQDHIV